MSLTSRYPEWMYEALKLQEPKIPIDLDSEVIQSGLDVYQNGWSLATYNHRLLTFSVQFDQDIVLIGEGRFPPPAPGTKDEVVQKKVIAISHDNSAILNGYEAFYFLRRLATPDQLVLLTRLTAAGAPSDFGWADIINPGQSRTWVVPQGWQLLLSTTATGFAEDLGINILWAEMPAGFNMGI